MGSCPQGQSLRDRGTCAKKRRVAQLVPPVITAAHAGEVSVSFAWVFCLLSGEMALTAEDVVTMLDSSFTGCDSSDDDLGMSIEEIENPHFDPDQGKQKS